jgi:hypothetical protein
VSLIGLFTVLCSVPGAFSPGRKDTAHRIAAQVLKGIGSYIFTLGEVVGG